MKLDLVDRMVALPWQLFYGTAIPACLWFLTSLRFLDEIATTLDLEIREITELADVID